LLLFFQAAHHFLFKRIAVDIIVALNVVLIFELVVLHLDILGGEAPRHDAVLHENASFDVPLALDSMPLMRKLLLPIPDPLTFMEHFELLMAVYLVKDGLVHLVDLGSLQLLIPVQGLAALGGFQVVLQVLFD
jgi:hypothetical protein